MKVKIKKLHPDAVIPQYAHPGSDAGLDLTAISVNYNRECKYYEFGTGLSIEIPEDFVGLIFPRSSISNKNMLLTNHVGVVDSGYRGEIKFRFKEIHISSSAYNYAIGEKVGQLLIIPYPEIELEEVEELNDSTRGVNGFGSSGV